MSPSFYILHLISALVILPPAINRNPAGSPWINIVDKQQIQQAAECLKQGGVIAYPTEAVWGLGCDPHNRQALERLLALKSRDPAKGVILIAASYEQVRPYMAESQLDALSHEKLQQLTRSWPGPNTWLVPTSDKVPGLVRGQHPLVAVRVTAHPLVQALCHAFGGPIVSTSANPAGEAPALNKETIHSYFADQLDFILEGELGGLGQPSTIRHLLTGETVRP